MTRWTFVLWLVIGCGEESELSTVDADGDGYSPHGCDCDDSDPDTYPGAPETSQTDAQDQNCDGKGEDQPETDDDGDGWTVADGDCDDGDATVFPYTE
jgi:hypothetical protein